MDSKLLIIPCDLREVPGTSQQSAGAGNRASVPISQMLKLRLQASMCFVEGHMKEPVLSAQTRDSIWVFCFQHTHVPCARRHPAERKAYLLHLDHLTLAVYLSVVCSECQHIERHGRFMEGQLCWLLSPSARESFVYSHRLVPCLLSNSGQ